MATGETFTEKLITTFNQNGIEKTFAKGSFLLKEGEIEKNIYLVTSGAIRVLYLSEFEEQTIRFGYEGSLINSLSSFLRAVPSEFYIEAIRKTTVKIISKADLLQLVRQDKETLQQYVSLLETLITQQIDREVDLLISSPTERLQRVLERSPQLFQQVPLKYIASYLRMTAETLSRIRNS